MSETRGPKPRTHCFNGHEFVEGSFKQEFSTDGTKNGRKCLICAREAARKYQARMRKEHPEIALETRRKSHLKRRYGLRNLTHRDEILATQGNACAICGKTGCQWGQSGFNNNWHVDHDHNNPEPNHRGILCGRCNLMLGRLEEVGIQRVTDYLKKYSQS